jgi:SHS2 domain-containing protein
MTYKFLPHTADVKVAVEADTLEEAFKHAAKALKKIICQGMRVKRVDEVSIDVSGRDKEALLYNFLEEFLYLLDAEDFLVGTIDHIKIEGNKLSARITGDKASNYEFTNEVKAVTYHEMFVKQEDGKWKLQYVVDV